MFSAPSYANPDVRPKLAPPLWASRAREVRMTTVQNARCLACGFEMSLWQITRAAAKQGVTWKTILGAAPEPFKCPRCGTPGKENWVCTNCGGYHDWPTKCKV